MNNKSGLILRVILGGYLVFLGVSVISQAIKAQPSDLIIKALFGVLFIAVGGFYAFTHIRRMLHLVEKESRRNSDSDAGDSTQPLFEKPQHDQSLYRTAPMPAGEIRRKIPAQETDLRANVSQLPETHSEKPQEQMKSQLKIQVEEGRAKRAETKDPVNLAIEIMRDEERNTLETAEELENDYEEK
ncbi:hypothetical protein [Mediterraneibacter agrestimuris]|uniref:hypothetical protein n=1 Tax=Mediterraneibacter agrestimuris TaxID=2941333 RepID=UPI00203F7815|nr:hypothetical protein [Mediterraneibacter agrestimuris]